VESPREWCEFRQGLTPDLLSRSRFRRLRNLVNETLAVQIEQPKRQRQRRQAADGKRYSGWVHTWKRLAHNLRRWPAARDEIWNTAPLRIGKQQGAVHNIRRRSRTTSVKQCGVTKSISKGTARARVTVFMWGRFDGIDDTMRVRMRTTWRCVSANVSLRIQSTAEQTALQHTLPFVNYGNSVRDWCNYVPQVVGGTL